MVKYNERRHTFAVSHTRSNKHGHGDEALVGVEEKRCHGPWDLREFVKVVNQEHHTPLQGPFFPSSDSLESDTPICVTRCNSPSF